MKIVYAGAWDVEDRAPVMMPEEPDAASMAEFSKHAHLRNRLVRMLNTADEIMATARKSGAVQ